MLRSIIVLSIFALANISTNAQITQPTAWTKAYDQVSGTCNTVSPIVAVGSNRMLVVAISQAFAASATQANPTTITYGGVALTLVTTNGATSGRMHTWLYYLKDNAVMDGTVKPLNVTLAGTHVNVSVWYSVFAGVDQVAAITTGNGFNNTSGSGPAQLSAAMAVNTNQQAVYYSSVYSNNTTLPVYTINANWTTGGNNTGNNGTVSWKNEPTKRTIPVANLTDAAATSAITPAAGVRWAMSAMVLPMAVVATPTLTISNPTTAVGAASMCGSAIKLPIHAFNITASGSAASTLTNFQFTTTGTHVAADITNYKIWWSASNSLAAATSLATLAAPGGPGLKTFTAFSLSIPVASTYYFWITADIAAAPVAGRTLTVSGSASTDMATTAIKAGGPTTASGTQTVATSTPLVSIAASPVGAICAGTSVTFTPTPTNGGTPTYQWFLNGVSQGSSATYVNAALANGNQVYCIMTSSLACAVPTTATSNTITMTVNPVPAIPGVISGVGSASASTAGLIYSISAVAGATTYNWTVPAGWSITAGTGTTSIVVTSGVLGQNGNITVNAGNACGTSAVSTLAVVVSPPAGPHDGCNSCHLLHNSPAVTLTSINGNANLCISCHNPVGTASTKPLANSMKATPGVTGTSHRWDMPSINATYQANKTTNAEMLLRLPGDSIVCSTCHNQHNSGVMPSFLRVANTGDALCKDCHSARNKGTYGANPANKGTHPVGTAYSGVDPRFLTTPTAPVQAVGAKVECMSCHGIHNTSSGGANAGAGDGNLLRATNDANLCTSCHVYKAPRITLDHKTMSCVACHYSHYSGSNNIYLINDIINTPNSGAKPVVFTGNASGSNYADGVATANGICESCHTTTDHFTNTVIGTTDVRHFASPAVKCVTCHPHNQGFYAQSNCFDCHNAIADKPLVGPAGGRRQIVDATGNGLGAGGDFKRTSHHVSGGIPNVSDCVFCHYMGDHKKGTVKLLDPDLGYLNVITYDPLNKSSVESFCLKCHDANGANGDLTPFSDNVTVPIVDQALWTASSHKGNVNTNTCMSCHDNGHGSNKSTMLSPWNYAGAGTGTDLMNEEEGFCLTCHGAAGLATIKVHLAFSGTANTATNFYKHDVDGTYRKHKPGETLGTAFSGTNRHIECVDCHNPHGAKAGTATAPAILPTMIGAKGVEPIYGATNTSPGAPTGFTWQSAVTQEYQVCYKCHSSYTTLPTYLPGGVSGVAVIADGLKKVTTGGVNMQIADSRDMASEYNPNNASYHPVMAAGKNTVITASSFQAGWSATSRVYCSSCHGNPASAVAGNGKGPHGSSLLHMLDNGIGGAANYATSHSVANANVICTKCHQRAGYISGNTGSRFAHHQYHYGKTAGCYDCHDTHGSEQVHLMNFNRNVTSCITAVTPNSQAAFNHAAGTAINSCVVTCHGKGHNTGSLTYNPAYN